MAWDFFTQLRLLIYPSKFCDYFCFQHKTISFALQTFSATKFLQFLAFIIECNFNFFASSSSLFFRFQNHNYPEPLFSNFFVEILHNSLYLFIERKIISLQLIINLVVKHLFSTRLYFRLIHSSFDEFIHNFNFSHYYHEVSFK